MAIVVYTWIDPETKEEVRYNSKCVYAKEDLSTVIGNAVRYTIKDQVYWDTYKEDILKTINYITR